MKVVIIGGVAGGASAAARLRRLDEQAQIIILEKGEYISYANCGLPYYIGGEITKKKALTLQTPESFYNRFRIDVRVGNEATAIDREGKKVTVKRSDGSVYEETYDKLILSPGAKPLIPPLPGVEDERIFTLRNIPDTYRIREYVEEKKPSCALVVGGGYIGIELAENLAKNNIHVTVAELADHVIAPLDYDMACDVHHYLRSNGIELMLSTGVKGFENRDGGLYAKLGEEERKFDLVILSVGVRPDSALAVDCGLKVNARGAILTSDHMVTSDPDIYAVGDAVAVKNFVTGQEAYLPLAGPANKQGRIAADNICGLDSAYRGTQGSAVLKLFDMTVASTGLNEASAKAAGCDYHKAYAFSASHATYYPGATNMSIKVLFSKEDGTILGAQLVGFDGVDKRCDVLATAIRAGLKIQELPDLELCYAPPFSSAKDPVNMLGFIGENILTGKVKQFYWEDYDSLPEDAVKLDVRMEMEFARGHVEGAVNIPLDSLRDRLSELDAAKPIYVNCQSALRSYIACRILTQNGFTCYNLAGGWRLYESVHKDIQFNQILRHPCGIEVE